MKKVINVSFFVLLGIALISNAGGRAGNWASAPGDSGNCSNCHTSGNNSNGGSITLTGTPTNIVPNTTYNMTLTLNDPTASVGGFQLVATDGTGNTQIGTFTPQAGTTTNDVNRLVQNSPQAFSSGSTSWAVSWTAPASVSTNEVEFYFVGNAANGNGGNGAGDFTYSSSLASIPLPVELTSFDINQTDQGVALNWETATEINNAGFEIQHSEDGKTWELLDFVDGYGNTIEAQTYDYIDTRSLSGVNYYRLRQVDYDGQFEYSPVVSIDLKETGNTVFSFYPNPVAQSFHVSKQVGLIQIYNISGQLVKTVDVSINSQIDVEELSQGSYIIIWRGENGKSTTNKFIKM